MLVKTKLLIWHVVSLPLVWCVVPLPLIWCVAPLPLIWCVVSLPLIWCVVSLPLIWCVVPLPLSQINPNKKTLLEAEVEKFLRHEGKAVIFKCSSKSCEYIVYIPRYMCGSPR